VSWFEKIDFEQCARLAKFNKILGKDLSEADDDYIENTLEILEFHHKQKFKQELAKRMQTTWEDINLWGWGSNQYG